MKFELEIVKFDVNDIVTTSEGTSSNPGEMVQKCQIAIAKNVG